MQGNLVARSYKREVFQSEEVTVAAEKIKCSKRSRNKWILFCCCCSLSLNSRSKKCDFGYDINVSWLKCWRLSQWVRDSADSAVLWGKMVFNVSVAVQDIKDLPFQELLGCEAIKSLAAIQHFGAQRCLSVSQGLPCQSSSVWKPQQGKSAKLRLLLLEYVCVFLA